MAVISRERGYLFIQAPKAASTAIGNLLRERHDGIRCPRSMIHDDDGTVLVRPKHASLDELIDGGALDSEVAARLFKFVSVRNPFDALVSMWTRAGDRVREAESNPDHWLHREPGLLESRRVMADVAFEDWIRRRFSKRRTSQLYSVYAEGMDFVVRFERLDAELAIALGHVGIDHTEPLAKVNPTTGRSAGFQNYYTPELREIVETVYRDELDLFGYSFNGLTSTEPIDLTT